MLVDITPELIVAFLEHLEHERRHRHALVSQRDHLLLGLLYNTAARVSEIITITVAYIVLDSAPCVHLHGNGRKQRTVPLWRSILMGAQEKSTQRSVTVEAN